MDIYDDYEKELFDKFNVYVKIRHNTFGDWAWFIGDGENYHGGFSSWMAAKIDAKEFYSGQQSQNNIEKTYEL